MTEFGIELFDEVINSVDDLEANFDPNPYNYRFALYISKVAEKCSKIINQKLPATIFKLVFEDRDIMNNIASKSLWAKSLCAILNHNKFTDLLLDGNLSKYFLKRYFELKNNYYTFTNFEKDCIEAIVKCIGKCRKYYSEEFGNNIYNDLKVNSIDVFILLPIKPIVLEFEQAFSECVNVEYIVEYVRYFAKSAKMFPDQDFGAVPTLVVQAFLRHRIKENVKVFAKFLARASSENSKKLLKRIKNDSFWVEYSSLIENENALLYIDSLVGEYDEGKVEILKQFIFRFLKDEKFHDQIVEKVIYFLDNRMIPCKILEIFGGVFKERAFLKLFDFSRLEYFEFVDQIFLNFTEFLHLRKDKVFQICEKFLLTTRNLGAKLVQSAASNPEIGEEIFVKSISNLDLDVLFHLAKAIPFLTEQQTKQKLIYRSSGKLKNFDISRYVEVLGVLLGIRYDEEIINELTSVYFEFDLVQNLVVDALLERIHEKRVYEKVIQMKFNFYWLDRPGFIQIIAQDQSFFEIMKDWLEDLGEFVDVWELFTKTCFDRDLCECPYLTYLQVSVLRIQPDPTRLTLLLKDWGPRIVRAISNTQFSLNFPFTKDLLMTEKNSPLDPFDGFRAFAYANILNNSDSQIVSSLLTDDDVMMEWQAAALYILLKRKQIVCVPKRLNNFDVGMFISPLLDSSTIRNIQYIQMMEGVVASNSEIADFLSSQPPFHFEMETEDDYESYYGFLARLTPFNCSQIFEKIFLVDNESHCTKYTL